jgi:hypothetical protein
MIQVEIEAAAVKNVADGSWLLEIELERVVLAPSGVLLGCWQVLSLHPDFSNSYCFLCLSLYFLTHESPLFPSYLSCCL